MEELKKLFQTIVQDLFEISEEVEIFRPEYKFGDYSTNIALKLSKKLRNSPSVIAEEIKTYIERSNTKIIKDIQIVAPGFINIHLGNNYLVEILEKKHQLHNQKLQIVCEFGDPNPLKNLHVGHLYSSIIGDGIANLLEKDGAKVYRVNFGGDVGLHVAKNLGIVLDKINYNFDELLSIDSKDQAKFLADCYVEGNKLYDIDKEFQSKVNSINKEIYDISLNNKKDSLLAKVYWTTREWSYTYFDNFFKIFGIKFEKIYPESSVSELGLKIVNDNIPGVYKKSDGAIIFDGSEFNLSTYVYINNLGLPTYSAKDVGLIFQKWNDYHFDRSIVITGNEQNDYMKNVLKSIELINDKLFKRSTHLTHGLIKLKGNRKMSSREGNVISAEEALNAVADAAKKFNNKIDYRIVIGAIKYSFLKQGYGPDIIFDPEEAISLEGNSGPYLQYSYARANAILTKSKIKNVAKILNYDFDTSERHFIYQISEYEELLSQSIKELKPHILAGYLYKITQSFNRFYENNRVIGDDREILRLQILSCYLDKLKSGLDILGIDILEKM